MTIYKGICISDTAKVWTVPGGLHIETLRKGDAVTGDEKRFFNSVLYLHLLSSFVDWTQDRWVSVSPVTVDPPPPRVVKVPFTLTVEGFKPYSGELEKV